MKQVSVVFISVIISLIFFSCSGNSSKDSLKPGDQCYLKTDCMGATSETSFDELNQVSNRKDVNRLQEMVLEGLVYILKKSDECTIKDVGFGKYLIRINYRDLWVSAEFVEKNQTQSKTEDLSQNDKQIDAKKQPVRKIDALEFKEGESLIGTKWMSVSNSLNEEIELNFKSKTEVILSSKTLGTINQKYYFDSPAIRFTTEGSADSKGYIYDSKLKIDESWVFLCIEK